MLTPPNFQFARQLGVEEVVVHLETYFSSGTGARIELSKGSEDGWGVGQDGYWTYETFADLINLLASGGLKLAAIENFAVKQWSDILLQGPQRDDQMAAMVSRPQPSSVTPVQRMPRSLSFLISA